MGSMSQRERARGRFVIHRERGGAHAGLGSLLGFGLCQVKVGCGRGRDWERALGKEWASGPDREREGFLFFSFFLSHFQILFKHEFKSF